jgi:hypothetical protein
LSDANAPGISPGLAERIRNAPFLADFAVPLPNLADADAGPGPALARLGELLGGIEEPLLICFRIISGDDERPWFVDAGPAGSQVTREAGRPPDVEAIVGSDSWTLLATGAISPLELFGTGRMRVRGDLRQGRRFVRKLQQAHHAPS